MTAPERGTATLAPERARRLGMLARTLVAAGRSCALYPAEDPALRTSIERQMAAVRDLLQLSFHGDVATAALHDLLALLSEGPEHLRNDGGSAQVGARRGHTSILVEQVDDAKVLEDRRETGAPGVVTHELPSDLFRPQVKILRDEQGYVLEKLRLITNTWETDSPGEFLCGVKAIDPESAEIDPLANL